MLYSDTKCHTFWLISSGLHWIVLAASSSTLFPPESGAIKNKLLTLENHVSPDRFSSYYPCLNIFGGRWQGENLNSSRHKVKVLVHKHLHLQRCNQSYLKSNWFDLYATSQIKNCRRYFRNCYGIHIWHFNLSKQADSNTGHYFFFNSIYISSLIQAGLVIIFLAACG